MNRCLDKIWDVLTRLGEVRKNEKFCIANIKSSVESAKEFLGRHHKPGFYEYQIEGKLECVEDELRCIIYLFEKGDENKIWKAWDWLPGIARKAEKIRILASLCRRRAKEKAEEMVENKELKKYFVKESLLVSPMIATLKKSFDHLPPNLRLCMLCLAPFPENFIIKKRLLIYWWIAEGFITKQVEENKSAEAVAEENFMELIQMGLIQPFYEDERKVMQEAVASVKACKVHPWIRAMLISSAMEAGMFEFYARQQSQQHHQQQHLQYQQQHGWTRVCLYEGESNATWLKSAEETSFLKSLSWLKAHLQSYERWVQHQRDDTTHHRHYKVVNDNQMKLRFTFKYLVDDLCLGKFNDLVPEEFGSSEVQVKIYPEMLQSLKEIFDKLYDDDDDAKRWARLHVKQVKLQKKFKELCDKLKNWVSGMESGDEVEEKQKERLKWVKFHVKAYERVDNLAEKDLENDSVENKQIKVHMGFMYLVEGCLSRLDSLRKDINLGNTNPWRGDNYETFCMRRDRLETEYIKQQMFTSQNVNLQNERLCRKQNKLLKDFESLFSWIEQWVNYLEMMPKRKNDAEVLASAEVLFSPYDLNVGYPSLDMKKEKNGPRMEFMRNIASALNSVEWYYQWEKLLAIINVTHNSLSMKEEWFQKLTNLRVLHLGRWQYLGPYIKVQDNAKLLNAFFKVAKRLKYLSLRGISNIIEIPPTISKCHTLQILDLKDCSDLKKLPLSDINSLHNLTHFDISQCKQLPLDKHHPKPLVGRLEWLQTLKGIAIENEEDEQCVSGMRGLKKLSIILPVHLKMPYIRLMHLSNLRVLIITWKTTRENLTKLQYLIMLPKDLKKLDLRSYPATTWPVWLIKHYALDRLYIELGKIKRFHDGLYMPELRVLRLRHLKLDEDLQESKLRRSMFPSLNFILH